MSNFLSVTFGHFPVEEEDGEEDEEEHNEEEGDGADHAVAVDRHSLAVDQGEQEPGEGEPEKWTLNAGTRPLFRE